MNFGAPPPGVPQVSFDVGGAPAVAGSNGEWGWAQTGLAVAGGVLSMTLLGYVLSGGKSSKEIRAELKRLQQQKKEQQMQAMQMMMGGGRGPGGPAPGQVDAMDGLFEAEAQARAQQQQQMAQRQAMREQEETQQMLQMVLVRCDQLSSLGQHEEAADLYVKCIDMLPPTLPDYMEVCVELVRMAVNALLEAGKAKKGYEVLVSLKDSIEEYPKPPLHLLFNGILAKTMSRLKMPEALDLYVLNVHMADEHFGRDSAEYTSNIVNLAVYKLRQSEYSDAIELLEDAIPMMLSKNKGPLTRDIYAAYLHLITCHVEQGHLGSAQQVMAVVDKQADPEDVSFYWHLSHVASLFATFDFVEEAEALYRRILVKWEEFVERDESNKRVLSLVGNTTNELSVLLLNTNRVEEAQVYRQKLKDKKWGLLTTSKYFVTRNSTILFNPVGDNDFNGMFKFSLGARSPLEKGMVIEIAFELTDGSQETQRYTVDDTILLEGISTSSNPHKRFEKRPYDVTVRLFEDETSELPIYIHQQIIPSSLNTMNVNSWAELEQLYRTKE